MYRLLKLVCTRFHAELPLMMPLVSGIPHPTRTSYSPITRDLTERKRNDLIDRLGSAPTRMIDEKTMLDCPEHDPCIVE